MIFGSIGARHAARLRKARAGFRRVVIGLWIVSVVGTVAGIPFADDAIRLARDFTSADVARPVGGIETTESAQSAMHFRTAVFKKRPSPPPKPKPEPVEETTVVAAPAPAPPAPAGSITEIIYKAADEFGVDRGWLLSIADCESGLNPRAVNPAGYYGLFQYDQSTWASNGYGSIYDPVAQSRTTARLIAGGQASKWANCL